VTHDPYSTVSDAASQPQDDPWDQVATAIDALVAAWEVYFSEKTEEPCLGDFLPQDNRAVRELALPELIKVDLEYRWQHDCSPRQMESYAEQFPELGPLDALPAELIYEEFQVRMQAGKTVSVQEIQQRFPVQATKLCTLVGGMAMAGTPTDIYFADTKKEAGVETSFELANDAVLAFNSGDKVDDFELLTLLGKGAFAQVFLARQVSMERLVALKIASCRGNESQTLAQLDHPNIVRVFDQRQNKEPSVHLLYMEVVPGGTLLEVVKRVRKLKSADRSGHVLLEAIDGMLGASGAARPENSPSRNWLESVSWPMVVCKIGAQLASGLAYAHNKGVMHRDIKPANVLLTPEGVPKLADFNVSYNGGREGENPEDMFGGSLAYMSPEQLQACHPVLGGSPQLVRGTSDVYSLGILLWELLCGRRPFDDESKAGGGELARIQRMIDTQQYVDFAELAKRLPKDCPESLRQVLIRCLQPRKDERYKSAQEVAQALELCLDPNCWTLMQEPTNLLWGLPLRFPLLAIILVGLAPNALAGYFNLAYNRSRILQGVSEQVFSDAVRQRFDTVVLWINGIAFPLGVIAGMWIVIYARNLIKPKSSPEVRQGADRVLFLGFFVSIVTLLLWTLSGIIFPIAINLGFELKEAVGFYTHFFVSLVLCGIVAMAYPYFLLTMLAVRSFLPALVRSGILAGPRWKPIQLVRKLNILFLALTALVPMVVLFLAVAVESNQKGAMMITCGVGVVGFIAMFWLERFINRCLNALERIAIDSPGKA